MFDSKSVDFIWLMLLGMTLVSAAIAETPDQGLVLTIIIAGTIAFKGRMIVDRFMELKEAHWLIRESMRIYFYVIPLLIVIVYLFPEFIAKLTSLN